MSSPVCVSAGVTVHALGEIIDDPKYYKVNAGSVSVFPLGYSMSRYIDSYKTEGAKTKVTCTISEKGGAAKEGSARNPPQFTITVEDDKDNDVVADSAAQAWSKIAERSGKVASVNGPQKCGLSDKVIAKLVSELDGAAGILARAKPKRERTIENALKTPTTGEPATKSRKKKDGTAAADAECVSDSDDDVPLIQRLSEQLPSAQTTKRGQAKKDTATTAAGKKKADPKPAAKKATAKPAKKPAAKKGKTDAQTVDSGSDDDDVTIASKLQQAVADGKLKIMSAAEIKAQQKRSEKSKADAERRVKLANVPKPVLCKDDCKAAKTQFDEETGLEKKPAEKAGDDKAADGKKKPAAKKKTEEEDCGSAAFPWPDNVATRKLRQQYAAFLWEFTSERAKVDLVKKAKVLQGAAAAQAAGSIEATLKKPAAKKGKEEE